VLQLRENFEQCLLSYVKAWNSLGMHQGEGICATEYDYKHMIQISTRNSILGI